MVLQVKLLQVKVTKAKATSSKDAVVALSLLPMISTCLWAGGSLWNHTSGSYHLDPQVLSIHACLGIHTCLGDLTLAVLRALAATLWVSSPPDTKWK